MDEAQNKKNYISAVIPAAGQGQRMQAGINKQFLTLRGKPILAYTLDAFEKHPLINEIVLVISAKEFDLCKKEILLKRHYTKVKCVEGGASRQESVFSGLQGCSPKTDYVLIHDGARPIISQNMITKCVTETQKYQATVVGVPVKNTIKVIKDDGYIDHTPDRSTLYQIQTPQCFEYALIMQAHKQALANHFTGSDDASLVERIHKPVKIVRGQYSNLKITTPEDLILAESIIDLR